VNYTNGSHSGFAYNTFSELDDYFCTSSMASSSVVAYRRVISSYTTTISGSAVVQSSWNFDATLNSTTVAYPSLFVDPVEVMWKASDLSIFEPSYASALATRLSISFTATATASSSTGPSPRPTIGFPGPTSPASPSPNLSAGAKAGIGVGAAVGALAIAAFVFFLLRWRKRRTTDMHGTPTHNTTAVEAPELVQHYNPIRQSDALSGTTYTEHIPKTPTSPMSPRQ